MYTVVIECRCYSKNLLVVTTAAAADAVIVCYFW